MKDSQLKFLLEKVGASNDPERVVTRAEAEEYVLWFEKSRLPMISPLELKTYRLCLYRMRWMRPLHLTVAMLAGSAAATILLYVGFALGRGH